jgi:hypothetical protein
MWQKVINSRVFEESGKLASEMVGASNTDAGRKNELSTQLRMQMKLLASRIDHGARVEASALPGRNRV